MILSSVPHYPVHNKVKKQCGQDTSLSDTSMDFKYNVTITNTAGKVVIEAFDNHNKVGGNSIRPQYLPEAFPVHTVEGLGKIYKVHIESSLSFGTLFNSISQCEDMIDTTPSSPEPCLFLAEFKVHSQ